MDGKSDTIHQNRGKSIGPSESVFRALEHWIQLHWKRAKLGKAAKVRSVLLDDAQSIQVLDQRLAMPSLCLEEERRTHREVDLRRLEAITSRARALFQTIQRAIEFEAEKGRLGNKITVEKLEQSVGELHNLLKYKNSRSADEHKKCEVEFIKVASDALCTAQTVFNEVVNKKGTVGDQLERSNRRMEPMITTGYLTQNPRIWPIIWSTKKNEKNRKLDCCRFSNSTAFARRT